MDGLRTSRTDGTKTYSYIYNGGTLSQMTVGSDTLTFTYDASGRPLSVSLGGTTYYYVTNLQSDVTAILNASGTAVVTYTYDAWGNPLTNSGDLAATLGTLNPLRYRGYVYDTETELYYLQSRYYDPQIGRFINADALASTGQGLLGNNMFAYCRNNPTSRKDLTGKNDEDATTPDENNEKEEEPRWKFWLRNMFRQREDGLTFSVGYVYGATWGGTGAGGSGCFAVDNSYNYALQQSDSVNVGLGVGASAGLVFTYTNADSVQDLRGSSSAYGITLCGAFGIAVDLISFSAATEPNKKCFGVSVSLLVGADADIHASESYTTSSKSWNPFKALYEVLFSK